jgi:hypothetical protein
MNTVVLAGFIFGATALAYLLVYPKLVQGNIVRLFIGDLALTSAVLSVVASKFWNTSETFSFGFFETNWFISTMLIFFAVEALFIGSYCRKFGIKLMGD